MKSLQVLETLFYDHLYTNSIGVTCFLVNGVKLSGHISQHDDNCFTLVRDGINQLVMKSALATVMPQDAFAIATIMPQEGNR